MSQWLDLVDRKPVLQDAEALDGRTQSGDATAFSSTEVHDATSISVLDFAMDYPSESDLQPMQWSDGFDCGTQTTFKQEILGQGSMNTSDASLIVSGPMLQYPPYIDLNYSEQTTPRKSVSRAPSTSNQAALPTPPFSFGSSAGSSQSRTPSRKRSDARLAPYPQQRPIQQNMIVTVDDELTQPLWVANATSQSSISSTTSLTSSSSVSYRQKALHRRSTSLASSFSSVDLKNDAEWDGCNHLTRPIVYSVHSVYNGSPSFSPPRAPNSPDTHAYRALMSRANTINGNPATSQKDREKARTEWVQEWLRTSYKRAPNSTVPRQALYASYVESCKTYDMKPQNSASFGKSVRTAFKGIKTRRLGRRGDSRYHYVSIAAAIPVEAERLNRFGGSSGMLHQVTDDGETFRNMDDNFDGDELSDEESLQDGYGSSLQRGPSSSSNNVETPRHSFGRHSASTSLDSIASSVPSRPSITQIAGFPDLCHLSSSSDALERFWASFVNHLDDLIINVEQYNAARFEMSMRTFWPDVVVFKDILQSTAVSALITQGLAVTYNEFIRILMDNVLDPHRGRPMSSMRKLATTMEKIALVSLQDFDLSFSEPKVELAARTGHLIVRICDVQQLTKTLLPILSNADRVAEMLHAWAKIDMEMLTAQAALACNCQPGVLEDILADFGRIIDNARTTTSASAVVAMQSLAEQIETIASMAKTEAKVSPRGFLIRVSFITSQIMRDLTLRSDSAFGLFQLLKTWIDDWCGLIILRPITLSCTIEPAFEPSIQAASFPPRAPLLLRRSEQPLAWYSLSETGGLSVLTPKAEHDMNRPR